MTIDGILLIKRTTAKEDQVFEFCLSLPPGYEPKPEGNIEELPHILTGQVIEQISRPAMESGVHPGVGTFQLIPHPLRTTEQCLVKIHIKLQTWSNSNDAFESSNNPKPSFLALNQTSKVSLSLSYLLDAFS